MSPSIIKRTEPFYISLLIIASFFWGAPFIFIKKCMLEVSANAFLSLRFGLALIFFVVLFYKRLSRLNALLWKQGLVLGILMFLIFFLQTVGIRYTAATNSAFITGLYMVFTPFISTVMYRKRPSWNALFGIMLALGGSYFLTSGNIGGFNWGDFLTLLCAVFCAFHIVMISLYAPKSDPILLAFVQILLVAILSLILTFLEGGFSKTISAFVWQTAFFTASLSTIVAFIVQMYAQRVVEATKTALILAMEPVFAAVVAVVAGGEILGVMAYVGAFCIMLGIIVSEMRVYRLRRFLFRITGL